MKNKILKILGVAVTLAMVLTLAAAFSAPVAASPDETINEWYNFAYPDEGSAGDWFYSPNIKGMRELRQAINGDLYVHVQLGVDLPNDTFDIEGGGELTLTQTDTTGTGTIEADIDGHWDGSTSELPRDFTADFGFSGAASGSAHITGTVTEDNLTFEGCVKSNQWGTYNIRATDGGYINVTSCGSSFDGQFNIVEDGTIDFNGSLLTNEIFKSTDGGRSWEATGYSDVEVCDCWLPSGRPGVVYDMVCSSIDEDVVYATDGYYVYKTEDGGDTWDFVARDSLEEQLGGGCGCCLATCVDWWVPPITSIDVTYDADDNPFVFIGTRAHNVDTGVGCSECVSTVDDPDYPGNVFYIGEAGYPANWTSLNLPCFHSGGYDAISIGCAPNWADTRETYVVVTTYDDGIDGEAHTWVVYTKGTVCGWYEFAELLWDCKTDNHFGTVLASRIGFPDDWEDTETLFVGVAPCGGNGGDVYLATDGDAIDLNVKGIITGCEGETPVEIVSLDVKGDTDEASLIAGALFDNKVYYSTDGGWSWDESEKDPTGEWATYVIFYEDTALVATSGCECAVSMSCGEDIGQYWNQISLIATDIDMVRWLGFSPGYVCEDTETMYMVTYSSACCDDTNSVFRHDGTYWERVFLAEDDGDYGAYDAEANPWWMLEVSPDFNTTNCVYLANDEFDIFRTTDAGCSWNQLTFPCEPRPCISAMVVIDEDTVIAGAACRSNDCDNECGHVYKTTRHGARPWDEYDLPEDVCSVNDFALEPGYEDPGRILLGDECANVAISEDGGETWELVGNFAGLLEEGHYHTWVVFDPTADIIYAAAGEVIARCVIDPDLDWADQEWEEIVCEDWLDEAYGIAAVGDTALYVVDAGKVNLSTEDTQVICEDGGVVRSLNPDADDVDDVVFERIGPGLEVTDGDIKLRRLWITCDTSDDGCAENVLWSLEKIGANHENVWVYEDTLAQPVVLDMPADDAKLTTTDKATLSWNELCDADCYEVALWSYCPECPDQKLEVELCLDCVPGDTVACGDSIDCGDHLVDLFIDDDEHDLYCCPCTEETCIVVDDLEPGTTYYWQVRVCQGKPTLSKWSEERAFTTAMMPVPFVDLCSPACGSQDIILTPNFAWGAVEGATGYEVELATDETFTAGVVKGETTVNAWVCPETLTYGTTYYWRVRAVKDGIYSDWTYCMFTTMPEPVEPTPPVVIEQVPPAAPPVINIPPAEMITPTWIYAIIGVGAALAIVVIVLIVRTRRPPA